MAFNSFFMAMKKHSIFISGDSKFQAFLTVYLNAFLMEWNFSWPRKKSWKVQKLMAMIFLMALQWHFHYLLQGMAPLTQMPWIFSKRSENTMKNVHIRNHPFLQGHHLTATYECTTLVINMLFPHVKRINKWTYSRQCLMLKVQWSEDNNPEILILQ